MNAPEGDSGFTPRQALQPTPALYDELVADNMVMLAKASFGYVLPLTDGSVIHDVGSGTGAATEALMNAITDESVNIAIKASDVNEAAIQVYRKRAQQLKWPAEAVVADSEALSFADDTFSHTIGNAFLFVLPNDGVDAIKEIYRTLKPGGKAIFNSFKYLPTMPALETASRQTRPEGSPVPRQGLDKWADGDFLRNVVEKGGFSDITMEVGELRPTTTQFDRYVNMLWSFIGGTTPMGWLKSDEENWDKAIDIIKSELKKTDGFELLEDGRCRLKFTANIAIATK